MALKNAYLSQIKQAQTNEQNQLKQNYNTKVTEANKQYDKNANNAYINYRQSQKNLPEQLSNQGLTGGASESANLKLQTAYSQNLNNNETGRQSTIDKLTNDYNLDLGNINNAYLKQIADSTASYDRLIAQWNEEERLRQEEEAKERARASYYSSGGGSGSYGGYNDYSSYADEVIETEDKSSSSGGSNDKDKSKKKKVKYKKQKNPRTRGARTWYKPNKRPEKNNNRTKNHRYKGLSM